MAPQSTLVRAVSLAFAVALAGLVAGCGDDTEPAATVDSTSTVPVPTISDAVALTQSLMPSTLRLEDAVVADLVDEFCRAAESGETTGVAVEVGAFDVGDDGRAEAVDAVGAGADLYCPHAMGQAPGLKETVVASASAVAASQEAPPSTVNLTPPPTTSPTGTASVEEQAPPEETSADQASAASTNYASCVAVPAPGAAPPHADEPGYGSHVDRDGEGVGCE